MWGWERKGQSRNESARWGRVVFTQRNGRVEVERLLERERGSFLMIIMMQLVRIGRGGRRLTPRVQVKGAIASDHQHVCARPAAVQPPSEGISSSLPFLLHPTLRPPAHSPHFPTTSWPSLSSHRSILLRPQGRPAALPSVYPSCP